MRRSLDILDVVLLGLSLLSLPALLVLRVVFVPTFAAMFSDFGGELPTSTLLVMGGGFHLFAAVLVVALALGGVVLRVTRGGWLPTALFVAAPGIAAFAVAFTFYALYAPIFELAGNVAGP